MCERTCPYCGSTDHGELYGLIGTHIICDYCLAILANRRDLEAAPVDLTEEAAEAWRDAGSGILLGAEAVDPRDDEMFGPIRWPLTPQGELRGLQVRVGRKAREWAEHYPNASDGRNTFILFAEWAEGLVLKSEGADAKCIMPIKISER